MRKIAIFAKSVFLSWGSAMSGIPSVPLAIAAFYVPSTRLKILFGSAAAILWFVCAFLVWSKENDRADRILTDLESFKQTYLDGRPQVALVVHAPETRKTWNELRNRQDHSQFFSLQHIGGRAATCVRVAPIKSLSGVFELTFSEIAVVSGAYPQTIDYVVHQPPFISIDGLNDTIEMLLQFFTYGPAIPARAEYDVTIHFQDGDTPRVHKHKLVCTLPGPKLTVAPAA